MENSHKFVPKGSECIGIPRGPRQIVTEPICCRLQTTIDVTIDVEREFFLEAHRKKLDSYVSMVILMLKLCDAGVYVTKA